VGLRIQWHIIGQEAEVSTCAIDVIVVESIDITSSEMAIQPGRDKRIQIVCRRQTGAWKRFRTLSPLK
jgi:hypothetical protein